MGIRTTGPGLGCRQDLPDVGADQLWRVREGKCGFCGDLPLGVLGQGTGNLVVLVTKMEREGVG